MTDEKSWGTWEITWLQTLLPTGLELEVERSDHDTLVGRVFEACDHRLGAANGVSRIVRFLPNGPTESWRPAFERNLYELATLQLTNVSRPLEWGSPDPAISYLVSDRYPAALASQFQADGIDPGSAWRILEKLAIALAALHQHGPHGDLRPQNIFVTELPLVPLSPKSEVWLADVSLGCIPFASHGKLIHPQMAEYFPPEWNGQLRAPAKEADIYTLGRIGCDLILGRNNLPEATQGSTSAWLPQVMAQLKAKGLAGRQRRIVRRMLAHEPTDRFADGRELLQAMQNAQSPPSVVGLTSIAVCFVILLVMLVISWVRLDHLAGENVELRQADSAMKGETASLTNRLTESQKKASTLEREFDQLRQEHTELRMVAGQLKSIRGIMQTPGMNAEQKITAIERVLDPPPSPEEQQARILWNQWASKPMPELVKGIANEVAKGTLSTIAKNYLQEWLTDVRSNYEDLNIANLMGPPAADGSLPRAFQNFRKSPWEKKAGQNLALAVWRDGLGPVSDPPNVRFQNVSQQVSRLRASGWLRKDYLNDWFKELHSEMAGWTPWCQPRHSALYGELVLLLDDPGNKDRLAASRVQLESLQQAACIWEELSDEKPSLSWDSFRTRSDDAAKARKNPGIEQALQLWRTEFSAKKEWKLKLINGRNDINVTKEWEVGLKSNGTTTKPYRTTWQAVREDFPDDAVLDFTWSPDQPIELWVGGEKTWVKGWLGRTPLIFKTFNSPVAPWTMNWYGMHCDFQSSDKLYCPKFEILDCPGPPQNYKGELPSSP